MADVHVLSPSNSVVLPGSASALAVKSLQKYTSVRSLVCSFFERANNERDADRATVVVLDEFPKTSDPLDALSGADKVLPFRYFFSHLNLIAVEMKSLNEGVVLNLNSIISSTNSLAGHRISRIELWTGTAPQLINDVYLDDESSPPGVTNAVNTMSSALCVSSSKSTSTGIRIRKLLRLLHENIDTFKLLLKTDSEHLSRLTHLVGHWSFPSHELSIDDLSYCAFLMLEFAFRYIKELAMWSTFPMPSANELMMFVFLVRDNYQHGNPFHNFRHAVDVMQACFHYLIRLRCLPKFSQFKNDPRENELTTLSEDFSLKKQSTQLEMVFPLAPVQPEGEALVPHLNPIQSLGLLLAAIGHDLGHPGVTNAFLINHEASTSQIYNERSVLELYHTSVFINRIFCICFPGLLAYVTDFNSKLTLKNLIIGSILATDMAEHFEYVDKLKKFKFSTSDPLDNKVKLISSLLIKCADISNVTRPLRVSSQWALVLSREFSEIETLEKKLANEKVELDVQYEQVPTFVDDVLKVNPDLHKGQLFFIKTFAEGLFNSILDLLPELKYTSDIASENKKFWLERQASFNI